MLSDVIKELLAPSPAKFAAMGGVWRSVERTAVVSMPGATPISRFVFAPVALWEIPVSSVFRHPPHPRVMQDVTSSMPIVNMASPTNVDAMQDSVATLTMGATQPNLTVKNTREDTLPRHQSHVPRSSAPIMPSALSSQDAQSAFVPGDSKGTPTEDVTMLMNVSFKEFAQYMLNA